MCCAALQRYFPFEVVALCWGQNKLPKLAVLWNGVRRMGQGHFYRCVSTPLARPARPARHPFFRKWSNAGRPGWFCTHRVGQPWESERVVLSTLQRSMQLAPSAGATDLLQRRSSHSLRSAAWRISELSSAMRTSRSPSRCGGR